MAHFIPKLNVCMTLNNLLSSILSQTMKSIIPEVFLRNSNIWKPIFGLSNNLYDRETSSEQTDQIHNADFGPYVSSYLKTITENFQININIKNYTADELYINICGNIITIEGKHENGSLNNNVQYFLRRYHFSDGYDFENAKSFMTPNGILTLQIPKIDTNLSNEDQIIQIHRKHNLLVNKKT